MSMPEHERLVQCYPLAVNVIVVVGRLGHPLQMCIGIVEDWFTLHHLCTRKQVQMLSPSVRKPGSRTS
jgi:hypothetical protein